MPLPEPGWQRALAFLAGAAWLVLLRLALPTPGAIAGDYRFDGERHAVAAVYDAIAALLDASGGPEATGRRAALTAALDHAQDALAGPRLRRYASSAAERRLHGQYAAALPLAEAATAIAWAGEAVSARAGEGPRRLAAAVRDNAPTGPLPAPKRSAPALRALDDALLQAADAFDQAEGSDLHTRRRTPTDVLRKAFGAGGGSTGCGWLCASGPVSPSRRRCTRPAGTGSTSTGTGCPPPPSSSSSPTSDRSPRGRSAGRRGPCWGRSSSPGSPPCCPGPRGLSRSWRSAVRSFPSPPGTSPRRPRSSPFSCFPS